MAAQPLTRARLIQILLTMMLLIVAFVWRTVVFDDEELECQSQQVCNFEFEERKLTLNWGEDSLKLQSSQNFGFSITVVDGQAMQSEDEENTRSFSLNTKALILESGHQRLTINIASP